MLVYAFLCYYIMLCLSLFFFFFLELELLKKSAYGVCVSQVFWVQCDCCNKWFHMICVGVSEKIAAEEDYMCVTCSAR